jgi:hypothetical protein
LFDFEKSPAIKKAVAERVNLFDALKLAQEN